MGELWRRYAACAKDPTVNLSMFFTRSDAAEAVAVAVCERCPVRTPCAEFGKDLADGVWGGTTPAGRGFYRGIRKKARPAA